MSAEAYKRAASLVDISRAVRETTRRWLAASVTASDRGLASMACASAAVAPAMAKAAA